MSSLPILPPELAIITSNAVRNDPPHLESDLFALRQTPFSGLGVFAKRAVPSGEPIFICKRPFVNVIYREFRKEACAECFFYDNGRKLKITYLDASTGQGKSKAPPRGLAWFCSEKCKSSWEMRIGHDGVQALASISAILSKRSNKAKSVGDAVKRPLTEREIDDLWKAAGDSPDPSVRIIEEEDDEDVLYFLLDGIISRHNSREAWLNFCSLVPSLQPYLENSALLHSHIRMYHFLHANLPASLLAVCTPETILALVSRDHGNSFGIFEKDMERDGEMLGYGSWSGASFFNHSCTPNLGKKREGRTYVFWATREVQREGEELCISYIGDSSPMSLAERRKRLQAGWGFTCQCERCQEEEALNRRVEAAAT